MTNKPLAPIDVHLQACRLEVKLERELNDSPSMFIYDLAEVVFRRLIKLKTLDRIADACCTSRSIWNGDGTIGDADGVKRQVDIALPEAASRGDLTGVCLIEDVEKARSKLKLLALAEVKVLEERNVKVAPAGCPQVEGWLGWATVRELRNSNRIKVEVLITNLATTSQRVG